MDSTDYLAEPTGFAWAFDIRPEDAKLLDAALANQANRRECGEPGLRLALANLARGVSLARLEGFPFRLCTEESIRGVRVLADREDIVERSTAFDEAIPIRELRRLVQMRLDRKATEKGTSTGSVGHKRFRQAGGFFLPDEDMRQSCGTVHTLAHDDLLLDIVFVSEAKAFQPAGTIDAIMERWKDAAILNAIGQREKPMHELVALAKRGTSALSSLLTEGTMSLVSDLPDHIKRAARGVLSNVIPGEIAQTWRSWNAHFRNALHCEADARAAVEKMDADGKTRVGLAQAGAYLMTVAECANGLVATTVVAWRFSRLLVNKGEILIEVASHLVEDGINDLYTWLMAMTHDGLANDLQTEAGKRAYMLHLKLAALVKSSTGSGGCVHQLARPELSGQIGDLAYVKVTESGTDTASAFAAVARHIVLDNKRKAPSMVDMPAGKIQRREDGDGDGDGDGDDDGREGGGGKGEEGQSAATKGASADIGNRRPTTRSSAASASARGKSSRAAPSGSSSAAPIPLPAGDIALGEELEIDPQPLSLGADAASFNAANVASHGAIPDVEGNALREWCDVECPELDELLDAAADDQPGHERRIKAWLDADGDEDVKAMMYALTISRAQSFRFRAVSTAEMDAAVAEMTSAVQGPTGTAAPPANAPSATVDAGDSFLSPVHPSTGDAGAGARELDVDAPAPAMSRESSRHTPHFERELNTATESPAVPSPSSAGVTMATHAEESEHDTTSGSKTTNDMDVENTRAGEGSAR